MGKRQLAIGIGAVLLVASAGIAGGVVLSDTPVTKASVAAHRAAPPHQTARAIAMPIAAPPAAAPAPADAAYVIKHILPIEGLMRQGDYYWDERGAPAGKVIVTVDLAAGTLSIFRAGYEIGTAVVIFGDDRTPTPLGVFPITQKDADHHSNIYDNAPMPYMLRLTSDGVSIHGSEVGDGYVTHGCIGVPVGFAKKLFGAVKLGDTVIVTRGEMLDLGDAIKAA